MTQRQFLIRGRSMYRLNVVLHVVAMLAVATSGVSAQEQAPKRAGGNEGKMPIGWKIRADAGNDMHGGKDTLSFVQMTPGFHVTTGPAAILWSPDSTAAGSFTVDGSIFLFPTKGRDQEGYGIFVGGQQLDGAAIKRQTGEDAMQNDLRVVAGAETVSFLVNGVEAASVPRRSVAPDGVFGLRVNHAVNAHVVKVTRAAAGR